MLKKVGKGLITELIYIFVFCICLIVSVVLINEMGLLKDFNSALSPIDKETKDRIVNKISTNKYPQMEYEIKEVAKKYVKNNYTTIPDNLNIRISTLISNGYLEAVYDKNNNRCTGYITSTRGIVFNKYKTYLRCGDAYQTNGYEYSKDW